MEISTTSHLARRLGSVLEPVVGQVHFSPKCHANYVALGFDPSPGDANGVALPDGPAYFASRGSLLGQVIGEHPAGVERALELLRRAAAVLPINGRPVAAGVAALDVPDDPVAAVWHVGDFLREYRGDCHNAAWVAAGLTATDIGILTELAWGMPVRSYSRTRGWTADDFDRSEHHLRDLGYLDGSGPDTHLSQPGRHAREQIEVVTDDQMRPALDALGDDIDELFEILAPWGKAVRAGKGYLGSGP